MANIVSHPWTHAIQFEGTDAPGLISVEGFRTLLENTYELRLGKAKKPSYLRSRAWLKAIVDRDDSPPVGYTTNVASWKHEIGYTNPESAKWMCRDGMVYNKKGKNISAPHTPSEDLYLLMTDIHSRHGHMGRDNFYGAIQKKSATPTKDFCNSFVNSCCPKALMWIDGGLVNPHQLPVAVARPAAAAARVAIQRDGPINNWMPLDNEGFVDNQVHPDNGAPVNNDLALGEYVWNFGDNGALVDHTSQSMWHFDADGNLIDAALGHTVAVDSAVGYADNEAAPTGNSGIDLATFFDDPMGYVGNMAVPAVTPGHDANRRQSDNVALDPNSRANAPAVDAPGGDAVVADDRHRLEEAPPPLVSLKPLSEQRHDAVEVPVWNWWCAPDLGEDVEMGGMVDGPTVSLYEVQRYLY